MNTALELHDSRVKEIINRRGSVVVHFQPAYLHKSEGRPGLDSGTGWVQEALLIFEEATMNGDFPDWLFSITDGELIIKGERHLNLIPVPFEVSTLAELSLICDSTHTINVTGKGARLELVGEPRYVEEFSPHNRAVEIQDAIREILFRDWDPIGVSDNPKLRYEYDSYIAPVYRILVGSRSEQELVEFLSRTARGTIGVASNTVERFELGRPVARRLLELDVKL